MLEQEITHLEVDLEEIGPGLVILRVAGEIDLATVAQFREALVLVRDRHLRSVIIDMIGVSFMDSTGLHALVEGKRTIHANGCNIVLIASRQVRRTLDVIFPEPLFATRVSAMEEALAILTESE